MQQDNQFQKGDIIKNLWAGGNNPTTYLLYLGKGAINKVKTYECIAYDGHKVHFFRDSARLEVVGHMDEFDAFMSALKRLKDMK